MEPFIDTDYFIGEIVIGQIEQSEVEKNLLVFIKKYQKQFLKLMLGKSLYAAFDAGLAVGSPDQKWLDMKAQLVDEDDLTSPIAQYVYYWYQQDNTTQTVGIGQMKPESLNGYIVANTAKNVKAWNDMVKVNRAFSQWLYDHSEDYDLEYPYTPVYIWNYYWACPYAYPNSEATSLLAFKNQLNF